MARTHETRQYNGDSTRQRGTDATQKGRGIFLVYVDIDAKDAKEFNEWYNTEHLPELLAVSAFAAARYEAVKGGPKYLAFYELENVECCAPGLYQPATDAVGGSGSHRP